MNHLCIAVVAPMLGAMSTSAADQTWTGKISDSMCGAKHNTSAEHGGKKMSDRDCTLACVRVHHGEIDVRDERRHGHRLENRHARQEEELIPRVIGAGAPELGIPEPHHR